MCSCIECIGDQPEPPSPTLSMDEYKARAIPRLAAIDALSAKVDFSSYSWKNTPEGERWQRLMDAQMRDEVAAGL